jgi:hypothetical protein
MTVNIPRLMPWPNPDEMSTVPEFFGGLKVTKEVSMRSCRVIEQESKARGFQVSRSTIATLCGAKEKTKLPPTFNQIEGLLLGCGLAEAEIEPWRTAYTRIKSQAGQDKAAANSPKYAGGLEGALVDGHEKALTASQNEALVGDRDDVESGPVVSEGKEQPRRVDLPLLIAAVALGVVVGCVVGALIW